MQSPQGRAAVSGAVPHVLTPVSPQSPRMKHKDGHLSQASQEEKLEEGGYASATGGGGHN